MCSLGRRAYLLSELVVTSTDDHVVVLLIVVCEPDVLVVLSRIVQQAVLGFVSGGRLFIVH